MTSRLRSAAKTAAVNVSVLAALLVLCELLLGNWLQFPDKLNCLDEWLHHAYCPGVFSKRRLTKEDGGAVVENYLDQSRVRVATEKLSKQSTDVSRYQVINIGDSFIEADEIPYDQTVGRVMAAITGKRVLDFGYGSWAPIIYRNWIGQQKLGEGVRVNIFLMVNDVTPEGGGTALWYRKQAKSTEGGLFKFELPVEDKSWKGFLSRNSYFYDKIPFDKIPPIPNISVSRAIFLVKDFIKFTLLRNTRPEEKQSPAPTPPAVAPPVLTMDEVREKNPWLDGDFSQPQTDCTLLDSYRRQFPPKWSIAAYLTHDYLSYAFRPACWDADQVAEVATTVEDIKWIDDYVRKVNGSVRLYVVPAGWSFLGENVPGKATVVYRMRERTTITSLPLSDELQARLPGLPVVSLERVIKKLKAEHPGQYYFPRDGHWTPFAHKQLGEWLAKDLETGQQRN